MTEGFLNTTFDQLGSVLQLRAECRKALQAKGSGWTGAPEAMLLLDDLNEHATRLIARCGMGGDAGRAPPERGSPSWSRLALAA